MIQSWYSSMNEEPGFTENALAALKAKVLAAKRDNQEVVCALMLDEMSIRKHVEWDGKRFRGFGDLGTNINDDSLPEAKVSVNWNWKVSSGKWPYRSRESKLDKRMYRQVVRSRGEGGVFHMRWSYVSLVDVKVAWC